MLDLDEGVPPGPEDAVEPPADELLLDEFDLDFEAPPFEGYKSKYNAHTIKLNSNMKKLVISTQIQIIDQAKLIH